MSDLTGTQDARRQAAFDPTEALIQERQRTHGDFSNTAKIAQAIKKTIDENIYTELSAVQIEALQMISSKEARILSGDPDEPEHWRDIAGYAMLVVKELDKVNSRKPKPVKDA